MTRFRFALACLLLAAVPACARTVYTNLHPRSPVPAVAPDFDPSAPRAWRGFFLFGWVPDEKVIDAAAYCKGTDHIERIETRKSFMQGLITAITSPYINIYSPYTGRVVCDRHLELR